MGGLDRLALRSGFRQPSVSAINAATDVACGNSRVPPRYRVFLRLWHFPSLCRFWITVRKGLETG